MPVALHRLPRFVPSVFRSSGPTLSALQRGGQFSYARTFVATAAAHSRATTTTRHEQSSVLSEGAADQQRHFHTSAAQSKPYRVTEEGLVQKVDYLHHPVYSKKEVDEIEVTHRDTHSMSDRVALTAIKAVRKTFDYFTGYVHEEKAGVVLDPKARMTEDRWLTRMIFLETVAGIPGMAGSVARHLKSLRSMKRDYGWVHTLLDEALNERMHLLTFLSLKKPGIFFRTAVTIGQGVFFNLYFVLYMLFPRTCHRFVGYLEEEAVVTYSRCIRDLDAGLLPEWSKTPAPPIAKDYWKLHENAMFRDVLLAIRADEANHRLVNHTLSDIDQSSPNPLLYEGTPRKADKSGGADKRDQNHSASMP